MLVVCNKKNRIKSKKNIVMFIDLKIDIKNRLINKAVIIFVDVRYD